jgi:hypothetical protein
LSVGAGAIATAQATFDVRYTVSQVVRPPSIGKVTGTNTLALPGGVTIGRFAEVKVGLSTENAKAAFLLGVAAGDAIVFALKSLRSMVALADHKSLVSPSTALFIDQTRISRLTRQSESNVLISEIDRLVAATTYKRANLIAEGAPNIRIQTSAYGGIIEISPQPLDSFGLGIAGLDLLSDAGVVQAVVAVDRAIHLADFRLDRLKRVSNALANIDVFSSELARLLSNGQSNALPRGSIVNLAG